MEGIVANISANQLDFEKQMNAEKLVVAVAVSVAVVVAVAVVADVVVRRQRVGAVLENLVETVR